MPNVINVSHIRLRIGSVITIPIHSNYIVEVCRVDWNPLTKSGTINVYLSPPVPPSETFSTPLPPRRDWTHTATDSSSFPPREEHCEASQEPPCSPRLR